MFTDQFPLRSTTARRLRPSGRALPARMAMLALLAGLDGEALAGTGDRSASAGTAQATLVESIVITRAARRSLVFGRFAAGGGGTVVVTPLGVGSVTGEVTFVTGSRTGSDRFNITGGSRRAYTIQTTGGTVSSGSATMAFTTLPSATVQALNPSGNGNFTVGGTLTVPAGAPAGSYVGTYRAWVFYN